MSIVKEKSENIKKEYVHPSTFSTVKCNWKQTEYLE